MSIWGMCLRQAPRRTTTSACQRPPWSSCAMTRGRSAKGQRALSRIFFPGIGSPFCFVAFSHPRQEGVVRFYVGIRVCDASTPRSHPVDPARAARQWIPPSIPPEQLAQIGYPAEYSRVVAEYPARVARQWIPPSIPPERLTSGSRLVSRQSCSPVDPAEYPAGGSRRVSRQTRAALQWIPPSIPPERLVSGSRPPDWLSHQSSPPVDPAEYLDPAEHPAEYPRVARQWIPPTERPAEYPLLVDPAEYPASIEPEHLVDPASIPPEQLASLVLLSVPPCAQLGLHFMLVPSCFECTLTLTLGKGDAFVSLWAANKQLRLIPRRVSFWKGLGFC